MLGHIIQATRGHAICMAPNMRRAEIIELESAVRMEPEAALLHELARSLSAWSWIVDGEVACMFGIVAPDLMGRTAYPWFLTTYLVERHARQFARACKTLLPELLAAHPHLVGMVDDRYTLSVRWLEWLGAKLGEPEPYGMEQMAFRRFELGA